MKTSILDNHKEKRLMISDDLFDELLEFRRKRNWEQFHKPKDLAVSLSVEAAELLEIFQWKSDEEVTALIASESKERIAEEAADVAIVLSYLCHHLDIDLDAAVRSKLKKNEAKYPVSKAYGSSKKYSEL
jgi:NTP pyrophosphatase (non-canonical NTP hydrolase)